MNPYAKSNTRPCRFANGSTIIPANPASPLALMAAAPSSKDFFTKATAGHLPSVTPLPLVLTYQFPERLFLRLRAIAGSGGFILLTKALNFTQNRGAPHAKLTSSTIGEGNAVNWDWFFLRNGILLTLLTALFLSQRFWYRSLWRMTANW